MESCIGHAESRIHPRSHFDPVMPDTSDFDWSLDVNVIGAVMGMKHGIKALRKRGGGSIITMSNQAGGGSRGANGGAMGDITLVTPMALISAAMDQLARVGAYYKNENIRVYGLKPGLYESPMVDEWVEIARNQMDPNMTKDALAGFNMFFKTCIGDPVHIARVVEVGPYPNRNPRAYPAHIDPHAARLGCRIHTAVPSPTKHMHTNLTPTTTQTSDLALRLYVREPMKGDTHATTLTLPHIRTLGLTHALTHEYTSRADSRQQHHQVSAGIKYCDGQRHVGGQGSGWGYIVTKPSPSLNRPTQLLAFVNFHTLVSDTMCDLSPY